MRIEQNNDAFNINNDYIKVLYITNHLLYLMIDIDR